VHLWETLTTEEMAALDPAGTVAVLPVAAIEQHGPHLPLGTDAIICDGILDAACARLDSAVTILRLPTQRIGHSPEHQGFPGTLSLGASTLLALWCDIGRSVAAAGLRKLLLFNSHGGQGALVDVAAQALRSEVAMLVVRCSYYRFALPEGLLPARERRYGLHGGQLETSLMLHLAPHLVRKDRLATFISRAEAWEAAHPGLEVEGETGIGWRAEDLNPHGAIGDARAASAELGVRLLDWYARRVAALLRDLALCSDTLIGEMSS
jgi:creatinine amidohydrolase